MGKGKRGWAMWRLAIALVVVACIAGGGLAVLGSNSLPAEVQAFTPLAYVASGAHKLFVTDYGPLNTALDYLYVLDARTGRFLRRVPIDRLPRTLAVDERRNRVIVGGDRGLDVVDAGSGTLLRSINLPDDVGLIHLDVNTGMR
jgi:outer membrane protein assembly factor BamB